MSIVEEHDVYVLIAEDNEELLEYMLDKLSESYTCTGVKRGDKALELAIESFPDILITDWMMPGLKGIDLVEKLKTNPDTEHIPIIMLTARDAFNDKLKGLHKGADDYLTKPFEIEELLARCLNIIRSREAWKRRWLDQFLTQPVSSKEVNSDDLFLFQLKKIIDDNLSDPEFNVSKLQKMMGLSRMSLHRKLKTLTRFSAIEMIRSLRMEKAQLLLNEPNGMNISEVAYTVGFSDPSYFTKCYRQYFGKLPRGN